MKKIFLKIITIGLGLILGSLVIEGALTAYHYSENDTISRAELISSREKTLQNMMGHTINADPTRGWENSLVIHPFFGYVYNPKLPDVNNFGFKTKYDFIISDSGFSLLNKPRKNLLVVGIFGGSFAELAGNNGEYLKKELAKLFPDRTPVILNFGVGGHALPQSAFIFIYFKELLDIVVFIDGLNEVWNAVENNKAGYPPEYAKAAHFQYKLSLNELTPERFMLTSQIFSMKKNLARVTNISLLPIIRQSLLVNFIWWKFVRYWDYQISLKSSQIVKSYDQEPDFFDVDDDFLLDHAVRQWKKYHRLIHEISSSNGIMDIHLLQPNPFVEKSKYLTTEELHKINNSYDIREYVVKGYPKLQAAVLSLKQSGLLAEDLSYLFNDIKGSIWVDAAHTDTIGYEIVLDRVLEIIKSKKSSVVQSFKE